MGPPANTCTGFRSNDEKIFGIFVKGLTLKLRELGARHAGLRSEGADGAFSSSS